MALIGTIRKNGWVLILAMALAVGGFILMDVVSNSQRYSATDVNTLGKVGDTQIKRSEFEAYEKIVYTNEKGDNALQIRSQAWTYFLERAIVEEEAKPLGLGVGHDELLDLEFGTNLSPVILERFKNDAGQADRAKLANIKAAIEGGQLTDPRARAYWATQEKEIMKTRLQEKLIAAVSKGMYTPRWQAEMVFKESNERRDMAAVRVPYDKVKDDEVQITDSDYENYLDENPHLYDQQEESRILSYVAFDVLPSKADTTTAYESVSKLIEGLRTAQNDSTFVKGYSGSYTGLYVAKSKFPASYADSIMSRPLGSILGPFSDEGEFRIVKIIDRKLLPDSVRASHILLRDATAANSFKIDSLLKVLESGKMSFDSMAMKVSQDGSAAKGGDLGWFPNGAMVQEFNDLCFLRAQEGKIYKIKTQFGWHLVKLTGKKFVSNEPSAKVAVIGRRIEPGKATQQAVKDKAVALIQQAKSATDLETISGDQKLQIQTTQPIKINDFNLGPALPIGDDARTVIRWAFDKGVKGGDMSKEVFAFGDPKGGYFDSKYLVAAVKSVIPKGKASVATLKAIPEATARVRAIKKAAVIKSKTQNPTDLSAIASQWNIRVDTLHAANFLQTANEPRITGMLFKLETGKVSPMIEANMGVAVIQPVTDKTQPQMPADITMFRKQMSSQAMSAMRTSLMRSLQRQHEVEDFRFKFW